MKPHLSALFLVAIVLTASRAEAQESTVPPKNTAAGVAYIGTDKCIECHQEQHASYQKTTHSISAIPCDPANEPGPQSFTHEASGFRYEVSIESGKLFHSETMLGLDGVEIATTKLPMAYSFGSGAHGKSYLYRDGDFWGQSPITWYTEADSWKMSPGFERAYNSSFRRKIESRCVFCHVGSIDRKDHNPYKFEIVEAKIGCERCHGPGGLHAKKYRENPDAAGVDDTIANPRRLSRELGEAICQQCHLQGATKAAVSNQDLWDFRPGLPLTDFQIDYQYRLDDDNMRVVGHVEQMHASECYIQTDTLTCTTCHDPHNPRSGPQAVVAYRKNCLKCHENEACGEPLDQRMSAADNSCYQCHMPKEETNISHAALHHHRIGIHRPNDEETQTASGRLLPIIHPASLDKREQTRCEALAKLDLLRSMPGRPEFQNFGTEIAEALIPLKQSGPVDALTDSRLAWLASMQGQREIAQSIAAEALRKEPRPTLARIEATSLLASFAFQGGERQLAAKLYRDAVTLHRDAPDFFYLGMSENNAGNVQAAINALEKSLEIDPTQVSAHGALHAIYSATNQPQKAAVHQAAVERNSALLQKLQN